MGVANADGSGVFKFDVAGSNGNGAGSSRRRTSRVGTGRTSLSGSRLGGGGANELEPEIGFELDFSPFAAAAGTGVGTSGRFFDANGSDGGTGTGRCGPTVATVGEGVPLCFCDAPAKAVTPTPHDNTGEVRCLSERGVSSLGNKSSSRSSFSARHDMTLRFLMWRELPLALSSASVVGLFFDFDEDLASSRDRQLQLGEDRLEFSWCDGGGSSTAESVGDIFSVMVDFEDGIRIYKIMGDNQYPIPNPIPRSSMITSLSHKLRKTMIV